MVLTAPQVQRGLKMPRIKGSHLKDEFILTHCLRGHEFSESNTRTTMSKLDGQIRRVCKRCESVRSKRYAKKNYLMAETKKQTPSIDYPNLEPIRAGVFPS